jgi:hypothetical protein
MKHLGQFFQVCYMLSDIIYIFKFFNPHHSAIPFVFGSLVLRNLGQIFVFKLVVQYVSFCFMFSMCHI